MTTMPKVGDSWLIVDEEFGQAVMRVERITNGGTVFYGYIAWGTRTFWDTHAVGSVAGVGFGRVWFDRGVQIAAPQ